MKTQTFSNAFPITSEQKEFFDKNGYLLVENILTAAEVAAYCKIYDKFLSGEIDCSSNRIDLADHQKQKKKSVENVTLIKSPSDFAPELYEMAYHERGLSIARQLMGPDAALDFDMLIDKAPQTASPTPWHQDAAYWLKLEDTRAASVWLALDEATLDNGCMWYVGGSHAKPLRPHRLAGEGGKALECDATEAEGTAMPLKPGSGVFHHGGTLHYSRGNTTDSHRRAFILNFRPQAMIDYERSQGFDHGRKKADYGRVKNEDAVAKS